MDEVISHGELVSGGDVPCRYGEECPAPEQSVRQAIAQGLQSFGCGAGIYGAASAVMLSSGAVMFSLLFAYRYKAECETLR